MVCYEIISYCNEYSDGNKRSADTVADSHLQEGVWFKRKRYPGYTECFVQLLIVTSPSTANASLREVDAGTRHTCHGARRYGDASTAEITFAVMIGFVPIHGRENKLVCTFCRTPDTKPTCWG